VTKGAPYHSEGTKHQHFHCAHRSSFCIPHFSHFILYLHTDSLSVSIKKSQTSGDWFQMAICQFVTSSALTLTHLSAMVHMGRFPFQPVLFHNNFLYVLHIFHHQLSIYTLIRNQCQFFFWSPRQDSNLQPDVPELKAGEVLIFIQLVRLPYSATRGNYWAYVLLWRPSPLTAAVLTNTCPPALARILPFISYGIL